MTLKRQRSPNRPAPLRLIQVLSVAVIIAGSMAGQPQPLFADVEEESESGCVWCRNGCPPDLEAYCHGKSCPAAPGSGCAIQQCHGVDDEWYSNRITCKAPN